MERESPFTISPVGSLRILVALRRKGQRFERRPYFSNFAYSFVPLDILVFDHFGWTGVIDIFNKPV
jgi:hypothetical protein